MCGRFTLTASPEEIMETFDLDELLDWDPSYNIAPTQKVLTIVNDGQKNRGGRCAGDWYPHGQKIYPLAVR